MYVLVGCNDISQKSYIMQRRLLMMLHSLIPSSDSQSLQPSHLDPVIGIQIPDPQRLALTTSLLRFLFLAIVIIQVQHRLADLRHRLHQLAHPARLEEKLLQPLVVWVCDKVCNLHGFDCRLAMQEEGCGLQDRKVRDDYFWNIGAL